MQEVELLSRLVLQVYFGLLGDVAISRGFHIAQLLSSIEEHLVVDLYLVDGFYLFLDGDEGSVGLDADPLDIAVGDHDVEVHVVGDESVCDEVVVVFNAQMVESLQALADYLSYRCDECRLAVDSLQLGSFFEALFAIIRLVHLPEEVILAKEKVIGSGLNDSSIVQFNGYALIHQRCVDKSNTIQLKFSLSLVVRVNFIVGFELVNALLLVPRHQNASIASEASLLVLEKGCDLLVGCDLVGLHGCVILVKVAIDDEVDVGRDFLP